jgi:DNA-binding PadR family transcriptional regulator
VLYEFIVLALLARRTAHGYWIAKVVNDAMGPYARVSNGRLYPLLGRLEREGLIASAGAGDGGRNVKAYALTACGRDRLRALMLDTTSGQGDYRRVFQLKAAVLDLVDRRHRLALIDHYARYCEAHVRHIEAEIEAPGDALGGAVRADRLASVMRHRLLQWRLERSWADELRRAETGDGAQVGGASS